MMDDLVAFLGACLDEDQRVARACVYDNATDRWHVEPGDDSIGWHEAVVEESGIRLATGTRAVNVHIARWDPARVLAEVAAKRALIAGHEPQQTFLGKLQCAACAEMCHSRSGLACGDPDAPWPCERVLLLAQPFAGRPGWRPEWATEVTA